MYKLKVIEPWEFETANGPRPFTVTIKKGTRDNWLLVFQTTIVYNEVHTKYVLSKAKKVFAKVDILTEAFENIILEMAIIPDMNEINFIDYDLDDFRGNFLTGELTNW